MAWQDEVRRLDEELAAGRLSPDEHQRRRDELTAQGDAGQAGQPNPPAHEDPAARNDSPVQTDRPDQNAPTDRLTPAPPAAGAGPSEPGAEAGQDTRGNQHSPFPPAFRWDSTPPNETTEVISPVAGNDAERTQVVHTPAPPPAPVDDSERTQVVQAGPPAPPRFGGPYPGGYPGGDDRWAQHESAPPWVSSEPLQEPNAGWMMQGPEFFEAEPKESNVVRLVAVTAAVLVLAGIAFGAWFLFGRGDSNVAGPQQTSTQTPPVTTSEQPEDPLAPVAVGGFREFKIVRSFDDVRAAGFLTPDELTAFTDAGAAPSRLLVTNFPQGKATILVTQVTSSASALGALEELGSLQIDYGFSARSGPPGVDSFELLDKTDVPPTLRALYVSRDLVIRIEMRGNAPGADPKPTTAKFEQILAQQLEKLPADA